MNLPEGALPAPEFSRPLDVRQAEGKIETLIATEAERELLARRFDIVAIERLEATGGVNIQSGNQVATGDSGVFEMKSQMLVLSGKRVTLSEDGNVATGCKLTVAMQSGRATLEGCGDTGSRPTILLQPKSAPARN